MGSVSTPEPSESWAARIKAAHEKPIHRKNIVDDGFFSHMAANASFEGTFEIPVMRGIKTTDLPDTMIPFSQIGKSKSHNECVCFFEKDPLFADAIVATDDFIDDLRKFPLIVTPDCSLYRDMPLGTQIANVYLSRLVGHHLQESGMATVPTVRWSDERSYGTELFGEPFAFAGAPHKSIVAIGTYGCIRGSENRHYFREGLVAMLDYLEPTTVLVYGAMPDSVFADLRERTKFVHYEDWTSVQHNKS